MQSLALSLSSAVLAKTHSGRNADQCAAPVVSTTRKSNFDLTGAKLVKRGCLVSWGGCRFTVLRVVGGRAYYGFAFSNSVACGLVQVVA